MYSGIIQFHNIIMYGSVVVLGAKYNSILLLSVGTEARCSSLCCWFCHWYGSSMHCCSLSCHWIPSKCSLQTLKYW